MIFVSGTKVMVPVAAAWRDFRDLKGRKLAVTRGTTNAQALKTLDQKFSLGITLVEGADHEDSIACWRKARSTPSQPTMSCSMD